MLIEGHSDSSSVDTSVELTEAMVQRWNRQLDQFVETTRRRLEELRLSVQAAEPDDAIDEISNVNHDDSKEQFVETSPPPEMDAPAQTSETDPTLRLQALKQRLHAQLRQERSPLSPSIEQHENS